ncbi:endonuclease [Blastopirellula marina]|uniref:Endonuclease n=1 Tax=Blastopirellula marina TaxID=124 RepID=A0A2S8GTS6_9BACT|nr:endonuclease [Blastopirellula marina]PQO47823.1 endonuclease [Blastopirellula marina]
MTKPTRKAIAKAILNSHGKTYAQQIGIRLRNAPAPLFQLLSVSLLVSGRISADQAVQAAAALRQADVDTPRKMADTTWRRRIDSITAGMSRRFERKGSTRLGQTAQRLMQRYDGDLRKLRSEAGPNVTRQRQLLQQFQGMSATGADLFLREVQGIWGEVYPYADQHVIQAARKLELPPSPEYLARLVPRADFPRLVAGIVRVELASAHDHVLQNAA